MKIADTLNSLQIILMLSEYYFKTNKDKGYKDYELELREHNLDVGLIAERVSDNSNICNMVRSGKGLVIKKNMTNNYFKKKEDENFNIPNLGVTDSNLDISYKFKTKSENSQFVMEPIYSKSSFGLSLDFAFDDGNNNFNFQSLALDDENSSWVYDIDSIFNLSEFISLTLDYSDLSGNSLIQNYGYRYLDINRRSLDLKQSIGLSFLKDNRNISIVSDNFINIGALRPVSHSKDFLLYERFFNMNGWLLDLSSEYAKFSNNTSQDVTMPYQIFNDVERISRDIELSKSFDFDSFEYTAKYLLSRREYDLKDSDETINSNSLATSQVFSTLEDRSLKIGLLWSSFGEDSILPILDSYPILPSPESNISLSPWVGKDRGTNSRKIFLLKSWETSALNFSLSTNIYEKYNFEKMKFFAY